MILALDFGRAIGDRKRMNKWPSLLGLTTNGNTVIIGKYGPSTHLALRMPSDGSARNPDSLIERKRTKALRPDETTANGAILAMALMTLMNIKRKAAGLYEFNRGAPCCQFIDDSTNGPTFYLYEGGYRASLYPAWIWRLPRFQSSVGYVRPLWEIICMEMASKDIVGLQDNRSAATVGSALNERLRTQSDDE